VTSSTLPEGASNLEFQDGTLASGMCRHPAALATPRLCVLIGTYEVLFSYSMPYDRKLELERVVTMPVDAVVIWCLRVRSRSRVKACKMAARVTLQGTHTTATAVATWRAGRHCA